jgi:hypothetical protein
MFHEECSTRLQNDDCVEPAADFLVPLVLVCGNAVLIISFNAFFP